jgi:hypothetical protein
VKRRSLLAAVRDRMRQLAAVPQADAAPATRAGAPPAPRPARRAAPDEELERLAAEARYHRDRFELYRARVISGSSRATSSVRLRDLEHAATGAEERLAHAKRVRSAAPDVRGQPGG